MCSRGKSINWRMYRKAFMFAKDARWEKFPIFSLSVMNRKTKNTMICIQLVFCPKNRGLGIQDLGLNHGRVILGKSDIFFLGFMVLTHKI